MKIFFGAIIGAIGGGILGVDALGHDALIPGIVIGAIIGFCTPNLVMEISKHI